MTGAEFIGKFNPNDNDYIRQIKEHGAAIHDLIEMQVPDGRMSAATKTAAQMNNKTACMLAIALVFIPKES